MNDIERADAPLNEAINDSTRLRRQNATVVAHGNLERIPVDVQIAKDEEAARRVPSYPTPLNESGKIWDTNSVESLAASIDPYLPEEEDWDRIQEFNHSFRESYHRKSVPLQNNNGPRVEHTQPNGNPPVIASDVGWSRLSRVVREHDMAKMQDLKEDMDTLLVVAGLFSAVLTAFVVESYKMLQLDSSDQSSLILLHISKQLNGFAATGGLTNSTIPPITLPEFQATPSAARVNVLWFLSLVCSLITASFGILVKQWLHEYMANDNLSPQAYFRIRFFRYEGLTNWHVFDIAAVLPLVLQLALILFLIGLSDFLRNLHSTIGWTVSGLIYAWLCLFVMTIFAPAVSSQCPWKTPFLKKMLQAIRDHLPFVRRRRSDERIIRGKRTRDVEFLAQLDALFQDDALLEHICDCLRSADIVEGLRCMQQIVAHRLRFFTPKNIQDLTKDWMIQLDFVTISQVAHGHIQDVLLYWLDLSHADLPSILMSPTKQVVIQECLTLVLSRFQCLQEHLVRRILIQLVTLHKTTAFITLKTMESIPNVPTLPHTELWKSDIQGLEDEFISNLIASVLKHAPDGVREWSWFSFLALYFVMRGTPEQIAKHADGFAELQACISHSGLRQCYTHQPTKRPWILDARYRLEELHEMNPELVERSLLISLIEITT